MKVMIAAAGTGGHVFPGLAVAQNLQAKGVDVRWLATFVGREVNWVQQAGVPMQHVDMCGVRGKGWKTKLLTPWYVLQAVLQARRILKLEKPDVVLVMGGYVSVPAGLAAILLNIPLCVHEQNSIAGLSNRLLAPISRALLLGLPLKQQPKGWQKAQLVGNPLRHAIQRQPRLKLQKPLRILVLGGSLGAHFLNTRLPEVVQGWPQSGYVRIHHQCGAEQKATVERAYRDTDVAVEVSEFIDDMGQAYAWADVVIARAGALTVSEIQQAARPAIFIPFPHAVDNHQYYNAQHLVSAGVAQVLPQAEATVDALRAHISTFLDDAFAEQCLQKMNQLAENTATEQVSQIIMSLATSSDALLKTTQHKEPSL